MSAMDVAFFHIRNYFALFNVG